MGGQVQHFLSQNSFWASVQRIKILIFVQMAKKNLKKKNKNIVNPDSYKTRQSDEKLPYNSA